MTKIKLCYRELKGLENHFRQIQGEAADQTLKGPAALHPLMRHSITERSTADQPQAEDDCAAHLESDKRSPEHS